MFLKHKYGNFAAQSEEEDKKKLYYKEYDSHERHIHKITSETMYI